MLAPRRRQAILSRWAGTLAAAVLLAPSWASAAPVTATTLADLSLEQLREVVVSTVSRSEERLDRAAAAVYVISAEDIRRSGAITLPEALRLAPMLDVARADANQYAISARGFNNVLANKMLVLIDGRPVYTPLFSGVFWEAQDLTLGDIDRIEVITGPSTALWGTNAVNGLIHVITRTAAAAQGLSGRLNAGNRERGAAVRYGARLGDAGHVRTYAKSYDRSDTHRADGSSAQDAAHGLQIGFRADWEGTRQSLTLQGDGYRGTIDQASGARTFSGGNVLARWERSFEHGGAASVQAFAERTKRDHPQAFAETLDTVDVVGQYGLPLGTRHRLLLGAGWRHSRDEVTNFAPFGFLPASRTMAWKRVFVQDRWTVTDGVTATLATSVERNPWTGTEVLPSLRVAWDVTPRTLVWGSASRAVRAPSRIDREFVQPSQPPHVINGGPNFESEVANVFELGLRSQALQTLSYSLTLFQHDYKRLRSLAPRPSGLQVENGFEGRTRGLEAWGRLRAVPHWRIDAGMTLLRQKIGLRPGAVDVAGVQNLGNDPRYWGTLRSSLDLTPRHAWELSVRRVGARPMPAVPAYTAVDTRLAWAFAPNAELALIVQNLLDARHAEWGVAGNRIELERAFLIQLRWRL
ncbi:MAG TPA: TonB-dependent receptor [Caldimonas sp.]|jgi:iron complex outermembrane receptor protein|nr:TonB-dependent receptor [Caldimonas sp.]HEX2541056.1 TonB-dependent receptor [Caldimonas sp.]